MTDFTEHATSKTRSGLSLLFAAIMFVFGTAFAEDAVMDATFGVDDSAALDTSFGTDVGEFSQASRLQVGMPIAQAIELLGGNPDSETEIGAACGMLDVLTWAENGTKIISVDGTVTSIVEGGIGER